MKIKSIRSTKSTNDGQKSIYRTFEALEIQLWTLKPIISQHQPLLKPFPYKFLSTQNQTSHNNRINNVTLILQHCTPSPLRIVQCIYVRKATTFTFRNYDAL